MEVSKRVIDFITKSNWYLLLIISLFAFINKIPHEYSLGILSGGLIVAVNFHLLKQTLSKMFSSETIVQRHRSILSVVLLKYYIRFVISGFIIYLLISKHIVHPLGLIVGLSVVVASMFIATMLELTRLFFKEAV